MPTIGLLSESAPVEPKKPASPKAKMPPSDATSQYPLPVGVAASPTIGRLRARLPVDPRKVAAETMGVAKEGRSGVPQQFPSLHGVASVSTPTPGAAMSTQGPRRENLASVSSEPSTAATDSTPLKAAG